MKLLVTGASGHLGANLVRRLLWEGEDVRVLVRPGPENNRAVEALAQHSDDSLVRSPGSNGTGSDDHASPEGDGSPDKRGSDGPHTSTAPEAVPSPPDGGGVDEPEDPPATAP